jgi:hypothetical protein
MEDEVPSPLELALSSLLVALGEKDPGLADRWVRHAENDALHAEVRRLHSKAPAPLLVANLRAGAVIAQRIRFIMKSHLPNGHVEEAPRSRTRRKDRG